MQTAREEGWVESENIHTHECKKDSFWHKRCPSEAKIGKIYSLRKGYFSARIAKLKDLSKT